MTDQRLRAVRGAVQLEEDTREAVLERTQTLLSELLARNDIAPDDVVSIVFTATDDIRSEFPAVAARLAGLDDVPRLCARELDVASSLAMPRMVRVLLHYYGPRPPEPVYLDEAARLLDPPAPD
jgi:chorismate mutase